MPRISGNLYNCAFNCALLTLLEKINFLAQLEADQRLPDEDDPVYINYKKFKTLFAQCYGLYNSEEDGLTWSNFNAYLLSLSFSAKEILFAPVFRCFIVEFASRIDIPGYALYMPEGYDRLNPDGIPVDDRGLDLDNGKYLQLDFAVMNEGFYQQFGINVVLHTFDPKSKSYIQVEAKSLTSKDHANLDDCSHDLLASSILSPEKKLSLYLKAGHYELQEAPNLEEYLNEIQALPSAFKGVYQATSEHIDSSKTNYALAQLITHVNQQFGLGSLLNAQNLNHYAENGRKFYPRGDEGTFTFSFIVLTIGAAQEDEHKSLYAVYLDCMSHLPTYNQEEAKQLATLILENKCNITLLQDNQTIQEILNNYRGYLAKNASVEPISQEKLALEISEGMKSESEYNLTSNFQFNCMIGLLAAGAILLFLAIFVAFTPTLAAVPVAFGISGSISLLASAGVFAYRQCSKNPANDLFVSKKVDHAQ